MAGLDPHLCGSGRLNLDLASAGGNEERQGSALAGLGRFEEAEPLILAGLEGVARDRGHAHRRTFEALQRANRLYEDWGKLEQAAAYRARLPEPYWVGRESE
jgi:hypothetical protein